MFNLITLWKVAGDSARLRAYFTFAGRQFVICEDGVRDENGFWFFDEDYENVISIRMFDSKQDGNEHFKASLKEGFRDEKAMLKTFDCQYRISENTILAELSKFYNGAI